MSTCTRNITAGNSFTLERGMNILTMSFIMSTADGDAGTFTGDGTLVAEDGTQYPSQAGALGAGEGQSYLASSPRNPITGTLAATTGTMKVIFGF